MRLLDLTIGTRHFYLPEETNLAELQHEIEEAARTGGGIIGVPVQHQRSVSALITPGMTVFIEQVDLTDDSNENDADLDSSLDVDLHGMFSDWNA